MAFERDSLMVLPLNDFSGGINSSVSPQFLADNEYQMIKNFEFDMNRLKTRGGVSAPLATYPDDIVAFYYDDSTKCYLVCLKNKDIYEEDLSSLHNKVGVLEGDNKPNFCSFDGKIFIASGGHLQYYDYAKHAVTTIEESYLCDFVFERLGRIVVCHEGDDNLYYSAVGDPYETGWKDVSNDDSTSKFIEIGYKDNGDILKAMPISGDIAVFKSNGRIYTLSGEYPNWSLLMTGENTDAINAEAIVVLGSSVAFMSNSGIKTLESVQTYGNFTVNELGRKFNKSLVGNIYAPAMFNIVRKRQLVIVPNTANEEESKKVFCYQYDVGAGIYFEFAIPIVDMQDTINGVMIASGKSLYRWDKQYLDDNGTAIEQEIITKELKSTRRLYTRRLEASFEGTKDDVVEFWWGNKKVPFKVGGLRNVIEFFNVCSRSQMVMKTNKNITLEYANLYLTEK